MGHLDENTIIAFLADKLSDAERRGVEEHIDSCTSCRKLLAAMGADSLATEQAVTMLETVLSVLARVKTSAPDARSAIYEGSD